MGEQCLNEIRRCRMKSLRDEVCLWQMKSSRCSGGVATRYGPDDAGSGKKAKKHRGGLMPRCRAKCRLCKSYLFYFLCLSAMILPNDYIAVFVIVPELAGSLGLSLGIVVTSSIGKIGITRANTDLCPLLGCDGIVYLFDIIAIIERRITNRGYTATDSHAGETRAIIERIITNRGYTIGDSHARETIAI